MKRVSMPLLSLCMAALLLSGLGSPACAEGAAPVAENMELKTYRNVSISGCLSAYDAEGEALSFEISTQPVKGTVELKDDGSFVYSPGENKRGRDYFGYKAVDAQGNRSQEATVIIRIEKQKKDVSYTDMDGSPQEYAATVLSEHGIFTGEQIGGSYCFNPDKFVSRGEFLSMCVLLSGEPVFSGVMSTGYADDNAIPDWMKGYVATAAVCGIDISYSTEAGSVLNPNEAIDRKEAALILDKAINTTQVSYMELDDSMPPELAQSCANLRACGIIGENALSETENLTRGEAAIMLSSAIELIERR